MDDENTSTVDQNEILLGVEISHQNNNIKVSVCNIDTDIRTISINEFNDNEHYYLLESYLVQFIPKESFYNINAIVITPDLTSEQDKLNEIFSGMDIQVQFKQSKDFKKGFQSNDEVINKLLKEDQKLN